MELIWSVDGVFEFDSTANTLKYHYDAEEVWIQPWGTNSFRVRATKLDRFPDENWALSMEVNEIVPEVEITNEYAFIKNGRISAKITKYGKITFYNQNGKILLTF